jgi:hypothetical protein
MTEDQVPREQPKNLSYTSPPISHFCKNVSLLVCGGCESQSCWPYSGGKSQKELQSTAHTFLNTIGFYCITLGTKLRVAQQTIDDQRTPNKNEIRMTCQAGFSEIDILSSDP